MELLQNKTMMKNILSFIIALVVATPIFAQNNVFLDNEFWKTHPSKETIDLKIKQGNDIAQANARNFDGVALAILQEVPNATIQYAISKKGNDVNKITHDQRTYIFWAANKGNVELMKFLIKKGAKTDLTDNKGSTVLNYAAISGQQNTKVYDLLLKHGADLKKDLTPYGANALLLAAPSDSDFKLINYFVSKGLDLNSVDTQGNGVFNYVAKTGNIGLMKQLLEKGIKGNDNAFIFASQGTRGTTNGIEVYKFLESVGLNPAGVSSEGVNALHVLSSRSKDMDVLNYFITKDTDVNQQDAEGNTPFLNAAHHNTLEVVTLLSKNVKDINLTNKNGASALALAVAYNSPEVSTFILNMGADVAVVDANGNNISAYLMQFYEADKENAFMKKLYMLNKYGLEFGKPQSNGNTLYHLALDKNNTAVLKFIKQFSADVNAKNKEGIAPLHKAAMKAQNTEVLTYLLSIGAKKEAVTDFEETAYDLASENELLLQQKASLEFLK